MNAKRPTRRDNHLTVDPAVARPSADRRDAPRGRRPIRALIIALVLAAVLLVIALISFIVLANTSAFSIRAIDTQDTEHLSAENIAKLANVEEGTTLLSIDEAAITANLKRNPWVGSVSYVREFPDQLKIVVTERAVDCLVKMSTGSVCWLLGDDSVWIEPVNLTVRDGQSADDVALSLAQEMGAVLVCDVPTSMSPTAGEEANDEVLKAIDSYREQFSEELASQIVRFSASGVESISCTLASGVEVSLGAPNNIDVKEAVINEILEKHPNQITYINVRVPSQPSYRKLGVESVTPGTGVTVDTTVGDSSESTPTETESATEASEVSEEQEQQQTQDQEMILGEDGNYYTYEQYWGLE